MKIHWLTAIDGSFTNAADWSGGQIPGPSDKVILAAKGSAFTVSDSVSETVNSVQLAANATLVVSAGTFKAGHGTGVAANAGTIAVQDGATLMLGGTVDNAGLISLGGTHDLTVLKIAAAGATLIGGGTLSLSSAFGNVNEVIGAAGVTLTNLDNTISGAGSLSFVQLVNGGQGVIDANGSRPLYIGLYQDDQQTTVTNAGLMETTGSGGLSIEGAVDNSDGGVLLGATLFDADILGGTLSGATTVPSSGHAILDGREASITNTGVITGGLRLLGDIDNIGQINGGLQVSGSVTLTGAGTVRSGGVGGIVATDSLINVDNTISGGGTIGANMTLVNESAGVIDGQYMVLNTRGGTIVNDGLIESQSNLTIATTTISDSSTGIVLAVTGAKISLEGADIVGGTLRTSGSGVIAAISGVNILDGTAGGLVSQGHISIGYGTSLTAEGALTNSGEIALAGADKSFVSTLNVGAAGLTLSGGGQVILTNDAFNVVTGAAATTTLTNADNLIAGAGLLGDGRMVLVNDAAGVIDGDGSVGLTIDTGGQSVLNAGIIETTGPRSRLTVVSDLDNTGLLNAEGGTLIVEGAVSGAGSAKVDGGALAFAGSFSQNVIFAGKGGLSLAHSQAYTGTLTGFSVTGRNALDLADIAFTGSGEASFSGTATSGVLTVTDGTHTARINLVGDYLAATFTAASDGHGGTSVTASTSGGATPPHGFASAMAAHGASSAGQAIHTAELWSARAPTLSAPRLMTV